jgi:hypothetical protein
MAFAMFFSNWVPAAAMTEASGVEAPCVLMTDISDVFSSFTNGEEASRSPV